YGVGNRERASQGAVQTAAPSGALAATSGTSAREFTDTSVSPPPSAPAPPQATNPEPSPATADKAPGRSAGRPTPVNGRLLVRSTPERARVRLDGRDVGETPVTLRDLAGGTHQIRVARDGYLPVDRRVTITASNAAQSVSVELSRLRPSAPERATPPTT